MFDDFVSVDTTPLYKTDAADEKNGHLLWGDGVKYDGAETPGDYRKVKARGKTGWVEKTALGGESLLEFYFIDVGQGDGVLIKTPDFRHVLIDAGWPRSDQDTGKNAADFVDWKFVEDYGLNTIKLDAMITSHCDADHYGGLSDLLDIGQADELDAESVAVERFHHAGLSWWKGASKSLGEWKSVDGEKFWTQLIDDRASAEAATDGGAAPQLHGWWSTFIKRVVGAQTEAGTPTPIERLSQKSGHVPGFEPNDEGKPVIKVLGPFEFKVDGKPALRKFSGGDSINTNGVSLLLRVDYGRSRTLLTGDLNTESMHALLDDLAGQRLDLQCDVAKACHHGSEDVSYKFLQAMQPAATVISSGDNEGHDHPRPMVVAASATTGYFQLDNESDKLLTPLVYSTELARSIDLGKVTKVEEFDIDGNLKTEIKGVEIGRSKLHLEKTDRDTVRLKSALVVGGLIYGLVNVRTDGEKILCATLDERDNDWRIDSFNSRF